MFRAIPIVLGLAALAWFVDVRAVSGALSEAAPGLLVVAVACNVLTRLCAAERNRTIARAGGASLRHRDAIEALFIANFWGLALPSVSAGAVATVLRYRAYGVPAAEALAILAASRIVELVAFVALAVVGLWLSGVLPATIDAMYQHVFFMPALVAATAFLRRLTIVPLLLAAGWASLQALLDALTVLLLARSLGLPLDLAHCLWINALAYLAILLPITIAGLGLREAAVVFAVAPLGIATAEAVALAVLMLAMTLVNALIGGGWHAAISLRRGRGVDP